MHGERAFSNYHHVLNRCKWDSLAGAKKILELILPYSKTQLVLVVDEHLERRRGKRIKAKATHRDPVGSSGSWLVKVTGIKWVVLSCLISFSCSSRSFALPFFCVPILPEDHEMYRKRRHRTGIDLICQMLCVIRKWLPNQPILLIGDGDYARVKLASACTKLNIALITRLRSDARLHDFPGTYQGKGRYPKQGKRLSKKDISPVIEQVQWYKGLAKNVTTRFTRCIWYAGKSGARLPLFAAWVEYRKGDEFILAMIGYPLPLSAKEIIEWYVKRWNLEVTFRESRDHLGVETQRQWADRSIMRTTPLLFSMYTLIVILGHRLWDTEKITPFQTAWYNKEHLIFSDLLRAVRAQVWRHRCDSWESTEFEKWPNGESSFSECLFAMGF